ncbi:MAG: ABC transporter substrate-binding protein [Promethearchaeota archaeon]
MSSRKNIRVFLIFFSFCISFSRTFYQDRIYTLNENNITYLKNPVCSQNDLYVGSYVVPGVEESITASQLIKIGLLDDLNYITGIHAWNGALLAAREVNLKGGVLINGNNYYVGVVAENTNELFGTASEGIEAAEKIINENDPHFIIGGYSLVKYQDVVMDHKIPFLSTGDGSNTNCERVRSNYEKYKYYFRLSPVNLTGILWDYLNYALLSCYALNNIDAGIVNKTAILRENAYLFGVFADVIKDTLPSHGFGVEEEIIIPTGATITDYINYWNTIESAGISVVYSMFFFPDTGKLMLQAYQQVKPQCSILSFSPFGSFYTDWDYCEGALQYVVQLQNFYNTSKTPLTIPFFTSYYNKYGIEPYLTAAGAFDAIKLLVQTVNETQTFDPDVTVAALEKINRTNSFTGVGGLVAFKPLYHDLIYGYPFGYDLFCQWKYIDGTKVVQRHIRVLPPSFPAGYPDSLWTGSHRLPYWGINGLLTDPPDPPGVFYLNCTAENPDYDGKFNLTWTNSAGADNYTVYMSDKPMTYISKNFETFDTYQTASSPYSMYFTKGEYYFRVVAYNKTGETMSSEVHVSVPGPGPFSLSHKAGDPDTDGKFDLIWTTSERADNYSIIRYSKSIIDINNSLTFVANHTTEKSFTVTGLRNGKYYFAVAAYNEMGFTLSNDVEIEVQIPIDLTFFFIVSISSVAGVASLLLVNRYFHHKTGKKSEREPEEPIVVEDMTRETFEHKKIGEENK